MALVMSFSIPAGTNIAILQDDPTVHMMMLNVEKEVSNGYLKIGYMHGNKDRMEFQLLYQKNAESPALSVQTYTFVPSVEDGSENFVKQGYEYLKTLPEFAGAVDV